MKILTTYKEYLDYITPINIYRVSLGLKDCLNPEDITEICINNWSVYTYVTISSDIFKFKNLKSLKILNKYHLVIY